MNKTRYFGMFVDPGQYRQGFGFRGWWLNFLNKLRISFEKMVALNILVIECKKAGVPSKYVKEQAKRDPSFIPIVESQLPKVKRTLLRDKIPGLFEQSQRSDRYIGEKRPDRPVPIEEGMRVTIAQAERQRNRSLRYLPGRAYQVVTDGEGIEAVKKNDLP